MYQSGRVSFQCNPDDKFIERYKGNHLNAASFYQASRRIKIGGPRFTVNIIMRMRITTRAIVNVRVSEGAANGGSDISHLL